MNGEDLIRFTISEETFFSSYGVLKVNHQHHKYIILVLVIGLLGGEISQSIAIIFINV
jgi:hypothetical protein